MNTPTPEMIDKLPKWAASHVRDCIRRRDEAESKLKDYLDAQSESLIFTRNGLTEKSYIQDDRVYFQLERGDICFALRGNTVECHASYRGGGRLIVLPRVTNVIHLEIEERE